MSKYQDVSTIGLREKETDKPVALYPKKAEGTDAEIEDKVKFWFYQQSCEAEEELKKLYVDTLTPQEAEALKN